MKIFKNLSGKRVSESRYFSKAIDRAGKILQNPDDLRTLIEKVKNKIVRIKDTDVWDELKACLRLLRAYAKKEYTDIPVKSILLITASIVYLLMPFDLIPDYIPVAGLIDDLALLRWALNSVRADINAFRDWEKQQNVAET